MKKLILEVDEQEANLVVGALAELPYKLTADLILKLRTQAVPQLANGGSDENTKATKFHNESDQEA